MARIYSRRVSQYGRARALQLAWQLHVCLRFLFVVLPSLALLGALPASAMPELNIVITDASPTYPCDETGLAQALADATLGSTISFQCGPGRTTISLSSEKAIPRGLTINGWNGGSRIVLDANNNSRVFTVYSSDFVHLHNLIFRHGRASPYGGAVDNFANLYISDCEFTANVATDNGGAVNNRGYIFIQSSQFYSNTAGLLGGAFASGSNADIDGSRFEGNSVPSGKGGAVLNIGRMTVSNSQFSRNRAAFGSAMWSDNSFSLNNALVTDNGADEVTVLTGGGVENVGTMSIDESFITGNISIKGGGVYNAGTLTIERSQIMENSSRDYGAGIFNGGFATIVRNTIANNRLATGTGIANFGRLTLNTSTLSGNSGSGAAVYSESPNVNISNSTLFSNTAPAGDSGNLHYAFGQSILLANTIIAGGLPVNCNLPQTSIGNNLEDRNSCGFNAPSDLHGGALRLDPLLGPLRDNGGSTATHALLPGSPAIDQGFYCLSTDQRGVIRPLGAACDIGAFEFNPFFARLWLPLVAR